MRNIGTKVVDDSIHITVTNYSINGSVEIFVVCFVHIQQFIPIGIGRVDPGPLAHAYRVRG